MDAAEVEEMVSCIGEFQGMEFSREGDDYEASKISALTLAGLV